jgi:hypothetical protein
LVPVRRATVNKVRLELSMFGSDAVFESSYLIPAPPKGAHHAAQPLSLG